MDDIFHTTVETASEHNVYISVCDMTFETSLKVTRSLFTLCCDLLKSITMNLSILILNEFVHVMYVRLVVYLLKEISTSSHSQRKPRAFPFKK